VSRSLSATTRAELYASETGSVLPVLLEITHGVAGYSNPLRIANNTEDLSYGGYTWLSFPFRFDPPDQSEDSSIANARITICAVDQQLAAILRSTSTPATVRAVATFYHDDGTLVFEQIAAWTFTLRNVTGNAETITADLIYEDRLDNEVPVDEFRPNTFPGLF
jgi:hypothetical protein